MGRVLASGTFNGSGAQIVLCIGFMPDWVRIVNLEDTDLAAFEWSINARSAEQIAGRQYVGSSGAVQVAAKTVGTGISLYRGGDLLSAASTVYLVNDRTDKRNAGTLGLIHEWT